MHKVQLATCGLLAALSFTPAHAQTLNCSTITGASEYGTDISVCQMPDQSTLRCTQDKGGQSYCQVAVLRPFDYSQGRPQRIESILLRLQGRENRQAFDAYLGQACKDAVLKNILPKLSLVNQRGRWVPARQLIWPSSNLDPAAQLCPEQSDILGPLHRSAVSNELHGGETNGDVERLRGSQLTQLPNFEAEVDKLAQYLRPFRNGNIGENLPAALVAVLGGHPRTLELLQELLRAGLHQNPKDFIALLLGENRGFLAENINSARFLVVVVQGAGATVESLTGESVTVEFTKEINTLIVGDPSDLWRHYYYQSRLDTACHRLRLRWIDNPDEISDPVAVFASPIETILLKVHCNGVSDLCPTNIKEQLADVADAGQADLRRSRSYLLDMAEARLKELGVRGILGLDAVLEKFTEARQARVDADLLSLRAPTRARQRREDASRLVELAKQQLVNLLESDADVTAQAALADAIRRKMIDFQYNVDSVAFELFQNADDALAELREMQCFLRLESQQFVLRFDGHQRTLEIVHWGRPINVHQCPGFEEGAKRGFDQDLQKMLTLNFSDKGFHTPHHPASVRGRFGLGFKSVLFMADLPEVISGRLSFQIRGGFFPVPLIPLIWRNAIAPVAERISRLLWSGRPRTRRTGLPPTELTQGHRRQAKGVSSAQSVEQFQCIPRRCITCGASIAPELSYCKACAVSVSRENLIEAAKSGRVATVSPKAQALRSATQRRQAAALKSWNSSEKPEWLDEKAYRERIQPRLAGIRVPTIMSALAVSEPYATNIRAGRCIPHPRHWLVLAQLSSVRPNR